MKNDNLPVFELNSYVLRNQNEMEFKQCVLWSEIPKVII